MPLREVGVRESVVQGYPQLHSKSETRRQREGKGVGGEGERKEEKEAKNTLRIPTSVVKDFIWRLPVTDKGECHQIRVLPHSK